MRTRRIPFLCLAAGIALASAQAVAAHSAGTPFGIEGERAANESTGISPKEREPAFLFPRVDPAQELRGESLIRALRSGGHVLYMRHTQTGAITPACTQSNLSPDGEREARLVGESLRALRIPIDRILSSPVCRVADTAQLLGFGEFETTQDLSNVAPGDGFDLDAARKARISSPLRRENANTLMVGHMHAAGANENDWIRLDFGEIIVYKVQPGGPIPVARIRANDWNFLRETAKAASRVASDAQNYPVEKP